MSIDTLGSPTREGNVATLDELLGFPPPVVVIGTTGTSTAVTALGDLSGVAIGDTVTGSGVVTTPPTTVVDLDNVNHTGTLSQATTSTVVATPLTFTPSPVMPDITLHLFKSTFSPTAANVYADFLTAECDFSGYAAEVLSFGSAGLDAAGSGISYAERVEFMNSTGVVGNSVGGAWLSQTVEEAAVPTLVVLRYFKFITPIPMSVALATMGAVVVLNTPGLSGKIITDN